MKKTFALLLLGFILVSFSYTDDLIARISLNLEQWKKSNHDERICLFLNQTKYSIRDTIFFSAYYSTSDLVPIKSKRIFSLGLISEKGLMISRINFAVENGHVSNQITIPGLVKPGYFQLVVYDPLIGKVMFSKNVVLVDKKSVAISQRPNNTIHFNFEGGKFISGVPNHLVVHGDPNQPISIIDSKNEVLLSIPTDSTGIGSTWFTPNNNTSYTLTANERIARLPTATVEGCAISISSKADQKQIQVSISTTSPHLKRENFILLVHSQKIISSAAVTFNQKGEFSYIVDDRDLPNGLTEVLVLNESSVLGVRLYYENKQKVTAAITLSKKQFSTGEVAEAELVVRDYAGNPLPAVFTATVNPHYKDIWGTTAQEDFLLNPVLTNYVSVLPNIGEKRTELINMILILENWQTTNWSDILSNKPPSNIPKNRIVLTGSVLSEQGKRTIPDSTLVNCFLQNAMVGYEGTVNAGRVEVPILFDFYGREDVFYSMEFKNKELEGSYKISLDSVAPKIAIVNSSKEGQDLDPYGDLSHKCSVITESYRFFNKSNENLNDQDNLNDRFEDEASGSDVQIKVDAYVVFPTMVDLVKEIVPFLEIKVRKNSKTVRLLINQKKFYSRPKNGPLYIIDGAMSKEQEAFLTLKPVDIHSIKLINDANKLTPFGSLGRNGIVLVQTKRKKNEQVVSDSKTVSILGLSKSQTASAEKYTQTKSNSRIPDVRSNLLWAPMIETSSKGESTVRFQCSDLTGESVIVIKGKTKSGIPFEASAVFSVD
jgi:hypothetical protein